MAYFTSQRYASAVYADVMCPSVRPSVRLLSVTSRYCIETTGEIQLVFGTDASLFPHCVKGNASIFNIRVVPLEICRKLWT